MYVFKSLRFRLLAGISLILILLFGLYSYYSVRFLSGTIIQHTFTSALRISDFIKSSTHYSMLLNRKDDVYQIIKAIGKQPGIDGIRIYNKRGVITFSTDSVEMGKVVDLRAEACYACHEKEKPLQSVPAGNRMRVYTSVQGHRVLGLINPIRNESVCARPGCHATPSAQTILGVLDVRMSLQELDAALAEQQYTMSVVAVITIVLVSGLMFMFLRVALHKPLGELMKGIQEVSSGRLDYVLKLHAHDEIGELAKSFNQMTLSLRQAHEEIQEWMRTLEKRVEGKTRELKQVHDRILQIEKMASLGRLSATVAHELNNPLEGILTYARLLIKKLDKQQPMSPEVREMVEVLELIARETDRCGTIVKNLLLFSKRDMGELQLASVRQIVERAAQLVQHHFEISGVTFDASYGSGEAVMLCDENQIVQALVALFVNAVEAMPGGGTLSVGVVHEPQEGIVQIRVSDTGVGIPEEHLPHIFEPFYTTKQNKAGLGLGLSVVYAIVERHGGSIRVESTPSRGTTFILTFPSAESKRQQQTTTHAGAL